MVLGPNVAKLPSYWSQAITKVVQNVIGWVCCSTEILRRIRHWMDSTSRVASVRRKL